MIIFNVRFEMKLLFSLNYLYHHQFIGYNFAHYVECVYVYEFWWWWTFVPSLANASL